MTFRPFESQTQFAKFWGKHQRVLNFSGCGTGKTLACIHAVKTYWPDARVLVLAPLTILKSAWANDLKIGWPEAGFAIAYSGIKRQRAFESGAQWVLTNHDAVKEVAKNNWHSLFDVLIIDEGDVFRNATTQRSKAAKQVAHQIPNVVLMTGTPTPRSITDVWHLAFLIDFGERLGKRFYPFRSQVCTPRLIREAKKTAYAWEDKEEAPTIVTTLLADITYRVTLEDVNELPETIHRNISIELPRKLEKAYETLRKTSLLELQSGAVINAIHAGAKMQKLLQLVSGGVYGKHGTIENVHEARHQLVLDLVEETDHALVAFNWKHQKEGLVREAKKRRLTYAVLDGDTPMTERESIVEQFQAKKLHVIFAHPQSASHGLTLTAANRIIWASPQFRADLYEQFNHRIVRTGQTRKTEIIHIAAENTLEVHVYKKMRGKKFQMDELLQTVTELSDAA